MIARPAGLPFFLCLALCLAAAAPPPPAPPTPTPAPAPALPVVTLEEAVRSALGHQPQLREAEANLRAATARADQQRAGLLPQLSAAGQVQRASASASVSALGARGATTTWTGQLSVDQVLFDAGTLYQWRAARASAESFRDTAQTSRLDVLSGVRAAYFAARAGHDLAQVARETVQNDQAHLRQVQGFVDVGTQPAIALAQVRSDLASAQLALIQAENTYANARAQLAQAMGLTAWEDFEVGDDTMPPVAGEDGELEPLLSEALGARPELATLAAQVRAEQGTRSAARAGYLPSVNAHATYGAFGPRLDQTTDSWTAGLSLSWSLFDGGLTRARVREADANLDALRAQEEALRTSIRVALEQAFLGVRAARSSLQAASEAEVNGRERLRLAEGRYQAGAGSIIELGDAQVAASTAAAQRVQAQYNLSAARAALLRALSREG